MKYATIELNFETNTVKIKRSLKTIYSNLENFRVNRTIVSSNDKCLELTLKINTYYQHILDKIAHIPT